MRDVNATAAGDDARASRDLVEGLTENRRETAPAPVAEKVPAKVYGVMALTTVMTFATLMTGYQLLFPDQLFA